MKFLDTRLDASRAWRRAWTSASDKAFLELATLLCRRGRLRGRTGLVFNVRRVDASLELDDAEDSDEEEPFARAHRAMARSTTPAIAPNGPALEELELDELLDELDVELLRLRLRERILLGPAGGGPRYMSPSGSESTTSASSTASGYCADDDVRRRPRIDIVHEWKGVGQALRPREPVANDSTWAGEGRGGSGLVRKLYCFSGSGPIMSWNVTLDIAWEMYRYGIDYI